jgi:hypothetical protein
MSDPVARQARVVALAFREKGLKDVAEMIEYLCDAADRQWEAMTASLEVTP